MDKDVVARQIISSKPDPPELTNFVHKSQLETIMGGTAPEVTRFWPPTMP